MTANGFQAYPREMDIFWNWLVVIAAQYHVCTKCH